MDIKDSIQQRIEAHKAEAHLNAILEYFHGEREAFKKMDDKIQEFLTWLWDESPIA